MTIKQWVYYVLMALMEWWNPSNPTPEPEPEEETKIEVMADFNTAYQITKRWEGGFQINPNDRGNYNSNGELVGTHFGIAAFVYEDVIGRPPTQQDMRNLTESEAAAIFKTRFWDKIEGSLIFDQQVANIFFDGAVNHGTNRGTKLLQEVLGVTVDGIVGGQTLNAINTSNPEQVFNLYKANRTTFYRQIAIDRPQNAVFLNGWLNRINSFNYIPNQQPPVVTNPPSTTGGGNVAAVAIGGFLIYLFLNR